MVSCEGLTMASMIFHACLITPSQGLMMSHARNARRLCVHACYFPCVPCMTPCMLMSSWNLKQFVIDFHVWTHGNPQELPLLIVADCGGLWPRPTVFSRYLGQLQRAASSHCHCKSSMRNHKIDLIWHGIVPGIVWQWFFCKPYALLEHIMNSKIDSQPVKTENATKCQEACQEYVYFLFIPLKFNH